MSPKGSKKPVDRISEIYIAVFPVCVFESSEKTETILAGIRSDPNRPGMNRVRATIETHLSAVPDLVLMCDEIVEQNEEVESYRLLKFDQEGVHELNPDDFRCFNQLSFAQYPETHWGQC